MTSQARHAVQLVVPAPGDLLLRFYPNGKLGGLSVDGQPPGALGEFLSLTVRVRKPPREFNFVGQLAWARRKGSKQLQECYGVDFQSDDDGTINRMLAFARNELPAETMRHERRVQLELPIKLLHGSNSRRERLADLSYGGAFVRTWDPLDVDEVVELVVRPPSSLFSIHLKGRVAWIRRVGDASGMGIEFLDVAGTVRRDVDRLLGRAR